MNSSDITQRCTNELFRQNLKVYRAYTDKLLRLTQRCTNELFRENLKVYRADTAKLLRHNPKVY